MTASTARYSQGASYSKNYVAVPDVNSLCGLHIWEVNVKVWLEIYYFSIIPFICFLKKYQILELANFCPFTWAFLCRQTECGEQMTSALVFHCYNFSWQKEWDPDILLWPHPYYKCPWVEGLFEQLTPFDFKHCPRSKRTRHCAWW